MSVRVEELVGRRVTVEVPATSANLGAGYDCLGLAVDIVNRIDLEVVARKGGASGGGGAQAASGGGGAQAASGGGGARAASGGPVARAASGGPVPPVASVAPRVELTVEGEGADELRADPTNRFVRALESALAAGGLVSGADRTAPDQTVGPTFETVTWRIHMNNRVPLSRGLGSSAAASVGGAVAGNALLQVLGGGLSDADLLRVPSEIEGHPDNAAPALLGGFVVSAALEGRFEAIRFDVPRDLVAIVFIPQLWLETKAMRAILPAKVPREDAVSNLGRVALGVAGLASGRVDLLRALTVDRLHEPYRAKVFPQLPLLVDGARRAGALGACLSGAGSTVIAFADAASDVAAISAAFTAVAAEQQLPGRVEVVAPRNQGAVVVAAS